MINDISKGHDTLHEHTKMQYDKKIPAGHVIVDAVDRAKVLKRIKELESKYNELLYAVAQKFPNESRHETALRYINDRESLVASDEASIGSEETQ